MLTRVFVIGYGNGVQAVAAFEIQITVLLKGSDVIKRWG